MSLLRRWIAVCSLPLLLVSTRASAQQPAPSAHNSTLSGLSADRLPNGDVVLSFVATGDLKGLVTFTIHQAANGNYAGGEWGFTVAHADNTDPATGEDHEAEPHVDGDGDAPHQAFLRLIHQGALNGTIGNVSLTFDGDGALTGMSADLTVDQGEKEFAGATGSGQAALSTLTLTF